MTTVMGLTSVRARMDSLETCARNVSIKAFNMQHKSHSFQSNAQFRPSLSTILNMHIMNENKQANKIRNGHAVESDCFCRLFLFHPSGRYQY